MHPKSIEQLLSAREHSFAGTQSLDAIKLAEELKAEFIPDDYLDFLMEFGCGFYLSEEFIGLGGQEHLDFRKVRHRLLSRNVGARFPPQFIPVYGDGMGNFDVIDLGRSARDCSYIAFWCHDGPVQDIGPVGYWSWFEQMLKDVLEDG